MWLHAERREKIRSYEEILNFLRCSIAGKVNAIPGIRAQPVKRMHLLLPFEVRSGGDGSLFDILPRFRIDDRYEAIDPVQRNGMQQECFRHAENRGVRAHTQRQRANADKRREAML